MVKLAEYSIAQVRTSQRQRYRWKLWNDLVLSDIQTQKFDVACGAPHSDA